MMLALGDFQDWVMVQVVSHSISLHSIGSFAAPGLPVELNSFIGV